jgi:hypothetical protein
MTDPSGGWTGSRSHGAKRAARQTPLCPGAPSTGYIFAARIARSSGPFASRAQNHACREPASHGPHDPAPRRPHAVSGDPARRCGGTAVHARSNADDLALVPGWRGPAQCRGGRAFRAGGSWLAGGDDRRSPIDSLQLTVGRPLFGDPIASGIQPSTGHDKGAAAGCCWLQLSFRRRRESAPAQTQGHHTVCTHRAAATGCAS